MNGTVVSDPSLDDACKVRVITELIEMTRRTIEGQALDIGWARDGRYDITPEDYLVMATHKTGALLRCRAAGHRRHHRRRPPKPR